MPGPVWNTIGKRLAEQWLAISSSPYFVTTCMKSPKEDTGWVALVFLAGYDAFPLCQPPSGPQEIAGMAMVETTVREEYPNGAYMLTLFADKTMKESAVYPNSDDDMDLMIVNLNRSLISTDGVVCTDTLGITRVRNASPLGNHYKATSYTYEVVVDITNRVDSSLKWWNVGRQSKKAITITWEIGHHVANWPELLALQLSCVVVGFFLLTSDFYLTITGLRGFLKRKPVLTYDLSIGMERRKVPMFLWVFANIPSILYADVARMYEGSNQVLWFFVCVYIPGLFVCSTYMAISIIQFVPSPFKHVVPFSSRIMAHGIFFTVMIVWMIQYANLMDKYEHASFHLGFNISGVVRPSGACSIDGVEEVFTTMAPATIMITITSIVVAIVVPSYQHKVKHGTYLVNLEWTESNRFLTHGGMPNWITGLPLEEEMMIKIGNKLFCKPSTPWICYNHISQYSWQCVTVRFTKVN
ncbi:hypothetical protein Ae201684P_007685 [Aphanomyces euteiches]|uniref:Uncharacterized protein n=1 Tax=Aphanomyces euteiches TaxID=100861 RepID=A0A6G0W3H6_9STRA|nr:hypothetical protein Ae201684_019065 [Aphanomyces euteiches]KAH9089516.1 hypothetical protein Ae201684P_007685 [Aphanomyces euteiches]